MSKQKHIIEVTPPDYQQINEKMFFCGYECPVCYGRGGWTDEVSRNEYVTKPCDYCDSTGKVMAEATIQWKPDYN